MFFLNKQNILVRFYFSCVVCVVMWHITRESQQKITWSSKVVSFASLQCACVCCLYWKRVACLKVLACNSKHSPLSRPG